MLIMKIPLIKQGEFSQKDKLLRARETRVIKDFQAQHQITMIP